MNIIDLETPKSTEKYFAPTPDSEYPFFIPEYGKTHPGTPCYQLRMNSPISCFQYVISGSGVIICDNRIYTVSAGDSFLLPEGKNQIYYSNPDNRFERIWINFKGELSRALIEIYGLSDTVVFKNTDSREMLEEMHKVCHNTADPKEYNAKTAQVFLKLVQFLVGNKQNTAAASDTIEEIRLFIDCHIMENLDLYGISEHFSFSREHIIRVFKRTYGITPHQYIVQSRIRIAMVMLKTTDDTIELIAERLRFSDAHHFSSAFKTHVGMRPSVYRSSSREYMG